MRNHALAVRERPLYRVQSSDAEGRLLAHVSSHSGLVVRDATAQECWTIWAPGCTGCIRCARCYPRPPGPLR
ncbi:hypothetical protein SSTU70S_02704 [Stutzerimonas stutzeri]